MNNQQGISLIETVFVLAVIAILGLAAYQVTQAGLTETRCIDGYKFVVGDGGQARQMVDANGRGVPCK